MFNLDPETRREFQQNYKAAIALGILMIVLGALAILYPFFATVFTFNVIGFVLLLFGILQLAYAFQTRNNPVGHFILNLLIGIFYLIVGFWILRHPIFSIFDLTLIIGILFFIEGAIQVINAFELRPTQNRGLLLNSSPVGADDRLPLPNTYLGVEQVGAYGDRPYLPQNSSKNVLKSLYNWRRVIKKLKP